MGLDDLLFINCGWMAKYKGDRGQSDKIKNGGSYVDDTGKGAEVCNFVQCRDGWVYGVFQKSEDVNFKKLTEFKSYDSEKDLAKKLTVVWVARDDSRRVVGWYRNAKVYGNYRHHKSYPSKAHKNDELLHYNVSCKAGNAYLLPEEDRLLKVPKAGIIGQTSWARPNIKKSGVSEFLEQLDALMRNVESGRDLPKPRVELKRSAGAARSPYTRYVASYEVQISPEHHDLQARFTRYIERKGVSNVEADRENVDLRFQLKRKSFLAEIKPCRIEDCRFAIRVAMGQLLDYDHCDGGKNTLLVVVGAKPSVDDIDLATSNRFAIAYPTGNSFKIVAADGRVLKL